MKVDDEHVQKPELGIWEAQLYVLSKWAVTILTKVDKIWGGEHPDFILSTKGSLPEEFYAR